MSKKRADVAVPMSPIQVAVTIPRAAALYDIGEDTFNRHIRPHVRLLRVGGNVLVSRAELERFAEENASWALD